MQRTTGTIISVKKQWWLKINNKPIRKGALDGAAFPYVIKVKYVVDGKEYIKRRGAHLCARRVAPVGPHAHMRPSARPHPDQGDQNDVNIHFSYSPLRSALEPLPPSSSAKRIQSSRRDTATVHFPLSIVHCLVALCAAADPLRRFAPGEPCPYCLHNHTRSLLYV